MVLSYKKKKKARSKIKNLIRWTAAMIKKQKNLKEEKNNKSEKIIF